MSNETKFLFKNNEFENAFIDLVEKSENIYLSVSMVSDNHDPFEVLFKNKHKIKWFFCGIENNLTSPEVLRKFKNDQFFHVINDGQIYHQKVYLFNFKDQDGVIRWESLIGSANLTRSSLYNNIELVQHTKYNEKINLHNDLEKKLSNISDKVTDEFIKNYEIKYQQAKKDKERIR